MPNSPDQSNRRLNPLNPSRTAISLAANKPESQQVMSQISAEELTMNENGTGQEDGTNSQLSKKQKKAARRKLSESTDPASSGPGMSVSPSSSSSSSSSPSEMLTELLQQQVTQLLSQVKELKQQNDDRNNRSIKPVISGLFGAPTPISILPAMPKLLNKTTVVYNAWVAEMNNYLRANTISQLVLEDVFTSFEAAMEMDVYRRPKMELLQQWLSLNNKVYSALLDAIKPAFGNELMNEMESKNGGATTSNPITISRESVGETQEGAEPEYEYDLNGVSQFHVGNSNELWVLIKAQIHPTDFDVLTGFESLVALRYEFGTDPHRFKMKFLDVIQQLKHINIVVPDGLMLGV
jgi:hypothetical protein